MTVDVSAIGISIRVLGSVSFPEGFALDDGIADDADPFDLPSLTIAAAAMNLNGQLIVWSTPQPLTPTINLLPTSQAARNMDALFEANRAASGKRIARDVITITATYPDGSSLTLSNGKILSGTPGKSVASAGRLKSKPYGFAFQDISITNAPEGV